MDVNSLYTNIRQDFALEAAHWALNDTNLQTQQKEFIMETLDLAMSHNFFWHEGNFFRQKCGVAMGAKYAPSIANIFMNKWESEFIFSHLIPQLKVYKRYIDDILIVWSGTMDSLKNFITSMGNNIYGISFTEAMDSYSINYLDLTIFKMGDRLHTGTFFKEVDRNGYIPLGSCHHPRWLSSIPKSQMLRIRRNCDSVHDYWEQSNILVERFKEKGYRPYDLQMIQNSVGHMDRNDLLKENKKETNKNFGLAFMSGYTRQHKQLEGIVSKHWPLLLKDDTLKTLLPSKPQFIYTKPPTFRNLLAHNVVNPPIKKLSFFDMNGYYSCGKCVICRTSKFRKRKTLEFQSHSNGRTYSINKFITCTSTHVTYLLSCPCGLQYVGRTTRELRVRLREHVTNIKKGYKDHSLSNHFRVAHNRDPSLLTFSGIDRVHAHWRGGNLKRLISQNESSWIYKLGTSSPNGLNIEFDLNCFLSNW